jgi:hypothetical protein
MNPKPNRLGPNWDPPHEGAQADALTVAQTAAMLLWRGWADDGPKPRPQSYESARHAVALHVISGRLHRLDERACSEDLGCRACQGEGRVLHQESSKRQCTHCAGTGLTTGRTIARLEAAAQEIAEHYGLRAYHQGDCRGCALYLCAPANATAAKYDQGHAVTRLGR